MEHVTPRNPTGPRSEGPNVAPPFYFLCEKRLLLFFFELTGREK